MITSIEGTLAGTGVDWVNIAVGGVTVKAFVPTSSIEQLGRPGERVRIFTSLQVREDSLALFGFPSEDARSAFESLIGVSRIGPRVALSVLSSITPEGLALAVETGDIDVIKGIHGVGTRTANRIVLELKGKLGLEMASAPTAQRDGEVVQALTALGYTASEAMTAVSSLPPGDSMTLEEKVRLCLHRLGDR